MAEAGEFSENSSKTAGIRPFFSLLERGVTLLGVLTATGAFNEALRLYLDSAVVPCEYQLSARTSYRKPVVPMVIYTVGDQIKMML